ncbi:MAG: glucosyl-3-phosphoglycerate synthase [Solirubrobacterales bacterium]
MTLTHADISRAAAEEWFDSRSYRHERFADVPALARRKRELGLSVSLVLPCREVADTIEPVLDEVEALRRRAALVDQVVVVDAGSRDGTADVARGRGAEVHDESELLPEIGPVLGKGDAMWRALSVARGDIVLYADADSASFEAHFIYGMLGPLLCDRHVRFVKATYHRPFTAPDGTVVDDAGRVTELTAKPLLAIFYPELAGFGQPLAGEVAGRRDLLCSIPFLTGYAVEAAMIIDVLRQVGLGGMAQVDLGSRRNRSQRLLALNSMAYAVARALLSRAEADGRIPPNGGPAAPESYLHAANEPGGVRLEHRRVPVVERPPVADP